MILCMGLTRKALWYSAQLMFVRVRNNQMDGIKINNTYNMAKPCCIFPHADKSQAIPLVPVAKFLFIHGNIKTFFV